MQTLGQKGHWSEKGPELRLFRFLSTEGLRLVFCPGWVLAGQQQRPLQHRGAAKRSSPRSGVVQWAVAAAWRHGPAALERGGAS